MTVLATCRRAGVELPSSPDPEPVTAAKVVSVTDADEETRARFEEQLAGSLADADRILLSSPDVGPLEREALLRAFDSGWVAPVGPELDAFEAELAAGELREVEVEVDRPRVKVRTLSGYYPVGS